MLKVAHDQDVAPDLIPHQAFQFPFSQTSDSKHRVLHQVAQTSAPQVVSGTWFIAHDIKFHSHGSLLIIDDLVPRLARPQTTSRHIAVDIQLRDAHDMRSTL